MRWLLTLAILMPGCVEYGTLEVRPLVVDLQPEGARLWVAQVQGTLDWGKLTLHLESCTDPSSESVLHLGNAQGAVNRGASATGQAMNSNGTQPYGACKVAIGVQPEPNGRTVRYGDFLEFCTTPKGREAGTMGDVVLTLQYPGGTVVERTNLQGTVPSCRL
ncbi:MAG TPA: hypothetical protein VI818_07575 [Candidatus Thermoplasmatota archaeon]|nr:hypothetical protein [Candidatus Thermoplasmatota archaeon]